MISASTPQDARPRLAAQQLGASIKHFKPVARSSKPTIWKTIGFKHRHHNGAVTIPESIAYIIIPAGIMTSMTYPVKKGK